MSTKITYFVHGTTTDNENGIATGWAGGVLSEIGINQAKELGQIVKNKKFDIVFCSDLKRAVDSANFSFKDKYRIIQDKCLREINYGDFTKGPVKEVKKDLLTNINQPFPNGESYKDVEKRISYFLEFLRNNYQEKHVAIVAHQGSQLALEVLLKGKTWEQAINDDWRNSDGWQPGWEYEIRSKIYN